MTPFLKTADGYITAGNGVYLSLDGQTQASLGTILHESWTQQERAAFGIYLINTTPPEGMRWTSIIAEHEGIPAAVFGPITITPAMVIAERARRLALGFDYDFGDSRGIHRIGTTEADLAGWDEVSKLTSALINLGATTPLAIVTDTGGVQITPLEWQAILVAAAVFRQPIWSASFALQAMSPIPSDYRADVYWSTE